MTDPAVAYAPGDAYGSYDRGTEMNIWIKSGDDKNYSLGLMWPGMYPISSYVLNLRQCDITYIGVTVFPDWFHPNTQRQVLHFFLQKYPKF